MKSSSKNITSLTLKSRRLLKDLHQSEVYKTHEMSTDITRMFKDLQTQWQIDLMNMLELTLSLFMIEKTTLPKKNKSEESWGNKR